ncbi:MAG: hypothetical protein KME17_06060 [Cyanosarcina radialis HA8281-LM2]|nr:hypothetical protein [Cyanosarcina radialis HA8281-LM2]
MKLLKLSNLVGKGLLVAGLATLSLALPATANTTAANDYRLAQATTDDSTSGSRDINYYPAMNDYQIGRHGLSAPRSVDGTRQTQSTSTSSNGIGGPDGVDINRYEEMNDYQIGRHGMWY